ncbi:hypothetical protein AH04_139 [Erwinia phage AH04]|uniref:Uncharacterized protein n=1 Tax=Erwinia phage AH04 TaxID=2869569 RepID=A0AAE7X0V0_9CAUD|nr:hypothetical protein PQC02_gp175 [Erwinia phage AH04]QZA70616.1 hypothetical protein AH04_139 [Erwinia phage AH04]
MDEKLKALSTIALWIIAFMIGGYLIFKPDSNLDKATVERLATVVDKLGVASDNMTKLADAQRNWFNDLQSKASRGELDRNQNYGTMYEKYGYGNAQNNELTLDDLYGNGVQPQNNNLGSGNVRGSKDANSKNGSVQKPVSESKGQSH